MPKLFGKENTAYTFWKREEIKEKKNAENQWKISPNFYCKKEPEC
jgi:hypothetical protein